MNSSTASGLDQELQKQIFNVSKPHNDLLKASFSLKVINKSIQRKKNE
jgi:hypothetical protein